MTVKCDGCGYNLRDSVIEVQSSLAITRWTWDRELMREGVLLRKQWKKPTLIYCKKCADSNPTTP